MSWGLCREPTLQKMRRRSRTKRLYDSYLVTPTGHRAASPSSPAPATLARLTPEYPAFSPNVLAVGGTSLYLNADNTYNSESAWGIQHQRAGERCSSAAGGGLSGASSRSRARLASSPVQKTTGAQRTTPDVSMVADPSTGAWIADPYNFTGDNPLAIVGGTSLSAPSWAGLIVLANEGRVNAGEPTLNSTSPTQTQNAMYTLPLTDFNAVTTGSNGTYAAGAGYNLVTGLGTPIANLLIPDLIAGVSTGQHTITITPATVAAMLTTAANSPTNALGPINMVKPFDAFFVSAPGLGWNLGPTAPVPTTHPASAPPLHTERMTTNPQSPTQPAFAIVNVQSAIPANDLSISMATTTLFSNVNAANLAAIPSPFGGPTTAVNAGTLPGVFDPFGSIPFDTSTLRWTPLDNTGSALSELFSSNTLSEGNSVPSAGRAENPRIGSSDCDRAESRGDTVADESARVSSNDQALLSALAEWTTSDDWTLGMTDQFNQEQAITQAQEPDPSAWNLFSENHTDSDPGSD